VLLHGIVGPQMQAALAADTLVVTVEEVVDDLGAPMNAIVLPHWVVTAVACVPGGAWPSYAQGYYARDNAFYQAWDGIARERDAFDRWIAHHVLGSEDHAALLRSLRTNEAAETAGEGR
jgi:glutaconate CoA-transferase subunit A